MLAAANREYENQQRLAALAVLEAQRLAARGPATVARSVQQYQAAAISLSQETLGALLAEQGISQAADATVEPLTLITAADVLVSMLDATSTPAAFSRLVQTLVGDAARTARTVDGFTRPAVTGYVRFLRPPSCARCTILAGRVYKFSTGFLRHPGDDCGMQPTTERIGSELVTDPMQAFRNGQISDLSQKDAQRVLTGEDLASVVNMHRPRAGGKHGLDVGTSVVNQASPQELLAALENRIDAFAALRQAGFITAA